MDVSAPLDLATCSCGAAVPDGRPDLVVTFRARELATALELPASAPASPVLLELTGTLTDGTAFRALDCLIPSP